MNTASLGLCLIKGCYKPKDSIGVCSTHRVCFDKYGTFEPKFEFVPLPGEVWLEVVGLEGRYMVSNQGRVKSLRNRTSYGRLRKYWSDPLGYQWIAYKKDGKQVKFSIHRAVAEAFIPNPDNKPVVNHIDNDPSNNQLTNLEWATVKENVHHSIKQGRMPWQKSTVLVKS